MRNTTAWDHGLRIGADGKGIVGHSGAVLLRRLADRSGLITALTRVLPTGGSGWRDRAVVFVHLAISIALGARSVLEAEQLALHQHRVFGPSASDSTIRRLLTGVDDHMVAAVARARARARRIVWAWPALRPGGFPWLTAAGKRLQGWVIVGLSATIITAASKKEGHRPPASARSGSTHRRRGARTRKECPAALLRTGSAGSNTVTDHIIVLDQALAQVPRSSSAKILVRLDGAGATHERHARMEKLTTTRRRVRFTTGWKITAADEAALAEPPAHAWESSLQQDGNLHDDDHSGVAELTGLNKRAGRLKGMRLIVRRVRPLGWPAENLTVFEKKTGWKYLIIVINITKLWGVPGSRQAQWLDALHRHHPVVEDRVRTNKAMGLHHLPATSGRANRSGMLAANIAADLDAWLRLLALHDEADLADAESPPCGCGSLTKPAVSHTTLESGAFASTCHGPGRRPSTSPGTGSPA